MTVKERLFDKLEIENCVSNILLLCDILNKPSDEYLNYLNKLNPKC